MRVTVFQGDKRVTGEMQWSTPSTMPGYQGRRNVGVILDDGEFIYLCIDSEGNALNKDVRVEARYDDMQLVGDQLKLFDPGNITPYKPEPPKPKRGKKDIINIDEW
jgi:hypothetical protein